MKYALVYGGIAGAIVVTILCAGLAFDLPIHATSVWFGYLIMLMALSLIFVGVKRYRDVECGGVIRFGRAFAVGLGIAVVAALVYVAGWEIFSALWSRDFIAEYTAGIIEEMRAGGASQAAIEARTVEMNALADNYRNPMFRIPMVFVEIFPVGLLVALVSAALLRNPRLLPARPPRSAAGQ
jgi:Protein of unknown function (DUF4199)